jgi:hypothetical protein
MASSSELTPSELKYKVIITIIIDYSPITL